MTQGAAECSRNKRALSIVAPAYNEQRRLPALLERIEVGPGEWIPSGDLELRELIVVDDGSTDETASILAQAIQRRGKLRALSLDRHRGKGAAVRAGVLAAEGELVLLTDVDMSAPLEEAAELLSALDRGFDLVIASRAIPGAELGARQRRPRELLGKGFNWALRLSTGLPLLDTQCGFKLLRSEAAKRVFELQRIEGYVYDAELCLNALRLGFDVAEVPVRWSHDPDSRVRLVRSAPRVAVDIMKLARLARSPLGIPAGRHARIPRTQ